VCSNGPKALRQRGRDYLEGLDREPETTRLPDRVQRRLDGQQRSRDAADARRSEAVNDAHQANNPSGGRDSESSHTPDGSRSSHNDSDSGKKQKKPKRKSKQNHDRPHG
jgi:hypothetical protein